MLLGSCAAIGTDPELLAADHPLLAGVDPAAVDTLTSAQAGFLLHRACTAGPGADPKLIAAMTELGRGSLRWFAARRATTAARGKPGNT